MMKLYKLLRVIVHPVSMKKFKFGPLEPSMLIPLRIIQGNHIVYSGSPIRVTNSLLKCKVNKLDLLTTTNNQISEMQVFWKIELAGKISREYKDCNVGDGARL